MITNRQIININPNRPVSDNNCMYVLWGWVEHEYLSLYGSLSHNCQNFWTYSKI